MAIKKLAAMLAEKRNEQNSSMMRWMRCCLSFSHARSTICCVCGSCFLRRQITWVDNLAPVDLVNAEAHLGLYIFIFLLYVLGRSCHIYPSIICTSLIYIYTCIFIYNYIILHCICFFNNLCHLNFQAAQ